MTKNTTILGIDISKDSFDVYDQVKGHGQFINAPKGFAAFLKTLDRNSWVVMEATGSYHHRLALYLFEKGVDISVVNPLVVKRFIQMKLNRVKTDKSDARMICSYGLQQELEPWSPDPEYVAQCKEIQGVVQVYFKQRTALKNKLHSLQSKGLVKGKVITCLKRQLRHLDKEIAFLEDEMESLIKTNQLPPYLAPCHNMLWS